MKKKKTTSKYHYAKGRRKSAVATVRLFAGKGDNLINNKKIADTYASPREMYKLYHPFEQTDTKGKFHFHVKTTGGGKSGQLDAITLALSRALIKTGEDLRAPLKKAGLLTVDARVKERKKPGFKKARKKQQFSKR